MNSIDDDIIIHPVRTKNDRGIPPSGILFVNPGEARSALKTLLEAGGEQLFLHNSQLGISPDGKRFIAGPAIGAPVATLAMEKLIVLGAKRLILMGWCGSIDPNYKLGDIVVPDSALSGEGTSAYYIVEKQSGPSKMGVQSLSKVLIEDGRVVKSGTIWSTDAPYRENKKFLQKMHQEEQVVAVDMEFSALCNVAMFRGIEFSAVMVVSDELWGKNWNPGFKDSTFRSNCKAVVSKLLEWEF